MFGMYGYKIIRVVELGVALFWGYCAVRHFTSRKGRRRF